MSQEEAIEEIKKLLDKNIPPQYHNSWMTIPSKLFGGELAQSLIDRGLALEVLGAFKRCFG